VELLPNPLKNQERESGLVGPGGVPSHCDSNELPCPADANARIGAQKQFLNLSSTRPRHAVTIVTKNSALSEWRTVGRAQILPPPQEKVGHFAFALTVTLGDSS